MATKAKSVVEKATGEKYKSKAAMASHEKGEGAKMRKMEAKGAGTCKHCGKPMKMAAGGAVKKASCMACGGMAKKFADGGLTSAKPQRKIEVAPQEEYSGFRRSARILTPKQQAITNAYNALPAQKLKAEDVSGYKKSKASKKTSNTLMPMYSRGGMAKKGK